MRNSLLWISLLASLAACSGGGPDEFDVTLAKFGELHVIASEQSVTVWLGVLSPQTENGQCAVVGADLTGKLAGQALALSSRGGVSGTSPGDDVVDNVCGPPQLRLDQAAPNGPSMLVVSDAGDAVTCNLPDLKAVRAMTADSWAWTPGQTVQVHWSPASDLALPIGVTVRIDHLTDTGTAAGSFDATGVTATGDVISFVMPAIEAGQSGSLAAVVSLKSGAPCTPADLAYFTSISTDFSASHPITLAP